MLTDLSLPSPYFPNSQGSYQKTSLKIMGCFSIKTHKESLDGVLATMNILILFSMESRLQL